jgi:hypothetical protein
MDRSNFSSFRVVTLVELQAGGAKVRWLVKAVENIYICKAEQRYEMPRLKDGLQINCQVIRLFHQVTGCCGHCLLLSSVCNGVQCNDRFHWGEWAVPTWSRSLPNTTIHMRTVSSTLPTPPDPTRKFQSR